jgi:hypothetical protein
VGSGIGLGVGTTHPSTSTDADNKSIDNSHNNTFSHNSSHYLTTNQVSFKINDEKITYS